MLRGEWVVQLLKKGVDSNEISKITKCSHNAIWRIKNNRSAMFSHMLK